MRSRLCATLCAILFAAAAAAQNVSITWIGQSCFYIQSEGGPTVVTDPPVASIGYTLPATPADVVTISHDHPDHNNSAGVRGSFTLVDGRPVTLRTQTSAAGLNFVMLPAYHDDTFGSMRGPDTIVRWTQGGLNFVHLGDLGQVLLTDAQLADMQNIDVLMFPAGGSFTLDAAQMAKIISQVKPRVAILMHFKTAIGGPAQVAGLPEVVAPFPAIKYKPSSVTLSKQTLPSQAEVWVMEPAADAFVVNPADFTRGKPVAPGGLATVFGTFAGATTDTYSSTPLPRKLGGVEVLVGGNAVPLLYASATQVNFQVPSALAAGQYPLEVRVGGQKVSGGVITTLAHAPELFVAADQAGRIARVRRGEFLTIYATGQGGLTPAVPDGAAPPLSPLTYTAVAPVVLMGTREIAVDFSGMAPIYVGLWVINIKIPADLAPDTYDLTVLYDLNLPSNALKIAVE